MASAAAGYAGCGSRSAASRHAMPAGRSAAVKTACTPGKARAARRVDAADARVRVRAAHEGRVQHAGQLDVVDEAAAAGEQRGSSRRATRRAEVRHSRSARPCARASPRRARPRRCPGSRCSGRDCRRCASRTSASLGSGLSRRNSVSVISMPGVQKPHCSAVIVPERLLQRRAARRPCAEPFDRGDRRARRPAPRASGRSAPLRRRPGPCRRRTRRARSRDACR